MAPQPPLDDRPTAARSQMGDHGAAGGEGRAQIVGVAAFVGAGASASAGFPLWSAIGEELKRRLSSIIAALGAEDRT